MHAPERPRVGPGRPSAAKAIAISAAITDAARELFLAHGFAGVTMDDIATRAGVPKTTIYKRHTDKVALLRFVILARIEEQSSRSTGDYGKLPDSLDERLKLVAVSVLCSPVSRELQALARLAEGDWDGAADVAKAIREASWIRMIDFLEQEIACSRNVVQPSVRDARSVAECLMAMLAGWLATTDATVCDTDAQAFAHRAVEIVIGGRASW